MGQKKKYYAKSSMTAAYAVGASFADVTGLYIKMPKSCFGTIKCEGTVENTNAASGGAIALAINGIVITNTIKYCYVAAATDLYTPFSVSYYGYFKKGDILTLQAREDQVDMRIYYSANNSECSIEFKED